MNNVEYTQGNQSKANLDLIVNPAHTYSALDMIDLKHSKWFKGQASSLGKTSIEDFCTMINRNYFDGLLNHTKKFRTSPKPMLNFKNALGNWINNPVSIMRIPSDLKLARLVLISEAVDSFVREQAECFNEQNHVLVRENGQTIFKQIEVMTVTEFLMNLEAQSWFTLRPNALEEIKYKYLTSTTPY